MGGFAEDGDDTRVQVMFQYQGFVRALNSQARLKGFEPTDTVRKLYGVG